MLQLWFVSRALGAMALLLLSVVVILGILHNTSVVRNAELGLPRFVLVALHRNLSLLAVAFSVLHVVTAVATGYVNLRWIDIVVPGIAPFNPVGAALGTIAFDLMLAIVITSLLRHRLSRRAWIWVHWSAYLLWPVAVAHAVLNTTFSGTTWWTLAIPLLAFGAILWALDYRWRDQRRVDVPAADLGKVPDEAIRAVTGETPVAGRKDAVDAARGANVRPPPARVDDAAAAARHAAEPDPDAETVLLPASEPFAARRPSPAEPGRPSTHGSGAPTPGPTASDRRRRVVPLAPRPRD